MRILVTGGTGVLGRPVVRRLVDAGQEVRVLSRGAPVDDRHASADLATGRGVARALAGVDVVVHCATAFGRRAEVALAGTLVRAALGAARPHLVYVSIVGVDRVPLGYYRGKLAAERLIAGSGLPHTILRATQFHDLVRVLLAKGSRLPVLPVPALRCQPVDVVDVAGRLAELAVGSPAGRAPDFGGPETLDARELARSFLRVTGLRKRLAPVRLPGRVFRAYRAGGHLAADHAGRITFEDHLAAHPDPLGGYRA
ncbi:SDR family oxidoreductase [Saccharothrix algeriensis]|uniref:NAD(P)H-binding protein n=1 Tax=Saccharothrix algeriensis TaxID=173560 RepID=A0A8T8I0P6_9PSEU|nr:NAD(P)H-binding protein [Saccharothrix algeriensis]MBM7809986.1 uncharacterized protein YbjT (DUF2867 family) [Saccharothrix algeriensis]QTR04229.1 NAD(P)H-binding protein [Saccharothrix algeriensis]